MSFSSSKNKPDDLKIPLEDIAAATNDFSDKNLIRRGGFGKTYKGQLVRSGELIDIVARRLDPEYKQGKKEFLMEHFMLTNLKHDNLVSIIGYCDDKEEKIIVNKYETHESLDKYLEDPKLTWMQRLEICVGVARALSYIHYEEGRYFSVIHRNIKSSKILLDDQWRPKLSGFEISIKNTTARRHRIVFDRLSGTIGYIDPKYEKTGGVTHKSDVYSLGVVLFEVLCGTRAFDSRDWLAAELKKQDLKKKSADVVGKLDEVVDVDGSSDKSAKQHSAKRSRDDVEKLDEKVDHEEPSPKSYKGSFTERRQYVPQSKDMKGMPQSDTRHSTRRIFKNYSVVSRTTSIGSLARENPFSNSSGSNHEAGPPSFTNPRLPAPTSLLFNNYSGSKIGPRSVTEMTQNVSLSHIGLRPHSFTDIYVPQRNEHVPQSGTRWSSERKFKNDSVVSRAASIRSLAKENPVSNSSKSSLGSPSIFSSSRLLAQISTEVVDDDGSSHKSAQKYSAARSRDVVEKLDEMVDHEEPSLHETDKGSFKKRTHEYVPQSEHLEGLPQLDTRPSITDAKPNKYSSPSTKDTTPTTKDLKPAPASLIPLGVKEESNVHTQQPPALNPVDMCMLTLAASARWLYEKKLGHLTVPEEHLLAPLAVSHYNERKLDVLIHPDLRETMHPRSLQVFSRIAYNCLKEQRSERPDIDEIVRRLQEALNIQRKHEKLDIIKKNSENIGEIESTSTNHLKWKNLGHLRIDFHDIEVATKKFSETHRIGSGSYGKVYKAKLEHFDSQNSSELQGQNTGDPSKILSTVAIKCISKRDDKQDEQGFFTEIKALTSCKHPNVVSLLGFCDDESHMILVYEYVSRGSLVSCLTNNEYMTNLKWVHRLQMCLDIAEGLQYLHSKDILHRDIKSDNILLNDKWVAKIADFGLAKICPTSQKVSFFKTNVAGTSVYLDPEYDATFEVRKASDIYSLGVVLFEIMTGRLAYDEAYMKEHAMGLAPFARAHSKTLKDMLDPKLKEEYDENIFTLSKGPNQDSLKTFLDVAYRCLAETHDNRPDIETVVDQLKSALLLQQNHKDKLQISLEVINSATDNFSDKKHIGEGGFGRVFRGEVEKTNGHRTYIAAKRLDKDSKQGETEFSMELEILSEYKHENVIGLVGFCNENGEKIIIYEYASHGSLDRHLGNNELTWRKRLEICIDIARGLHFLHGGTGATKEVVMHRDIKSPNILLVDNWKAKISDFGLSSITSINEVVIDNGCGTKGYCDPLYLVDGVFTKESDIYSFGVLLFEILCGRLMFKQIKKKSKTLTKTLIDSYKRYHEDGKLDKYVFESIKGKYAPESLDTFKTLANECVHDQREKRPTTGDVLKRLEQALEFQEDYEIWAPKLPNDYEEIFKMSKESKTYFTKKKKDLHHMLSRGILLQGKVMISLGNNGERNEIISARKFLYKHRRLHMWQSLPESRFHKVAQIPNISNLKIQIKAQFLSPGVSYGVHLIFRFRGPRKSLAKQMYVNLKYKMGSESFHAYFATWREDGWIMIELCQFLNHRKDTFIEFVLESFSKCYCGSRAIYIEGIEFRAIENVKHKDTENSKEARNVQRSNSNMNQVQPLPTKVEKLVWRFEKSDESEKLLSQNKESKKKHYVLLAKEALYESSDVKLDDIKPSPQFRSQDVIELPPEQVFRIKCNIESQRLSPNTEYACYLVFKLSEKCNGLHCPVMVRYLIKRKNKEKGIIYFRTPSPCNVNDTDWVPKEREDGWMEVNVRQFNSKKELRDDCVSINLKLICYEGTMSGLIARSLEFRPM